MAGLSINILKGSGWKTRLLNPMDEFWDRRLGISTFGYTPAVGEDGALNLQMHYEPTPYRLVFKALKHVNATADDVFVDFGSGMGRTVFAANWAGCGRSVGVEIDPALHEQASLNLERSAVTDGRIHFLQASAQDYSPRGTTIVYLFHPFGRGTLQEVVANLQLDIMAQPRKVRVIYNNPVFADVFEASSVFSKTAEWWPEETETAYKVAFFETRM